MTSNVDDDDLAVGVSLSAWRAADRMPRDATASARLETVGVRTLALLRLVGMAYTLVFVVVWWQWYSTDPARLVGVIAALLWGTVFVLACRAGRAPTWCVLGNVAVSLSLALSARIWLPPDTVGESSTWVFLHLVGASTIAAWCLTSAWWVVVPVVSSVAFIGGSAGSSPRVVSAEVLLFLFAGLFRLTKRGLRRSAVKADSWLADVRVRETALAVANNRARGRREQERIIHDTVLNTLAGIGWGGGSDVEATRARCADSVDAVTAMLDGLPGRGGDLAERIDDAIRQARRDGLSIDLRYSETDVGEPGEPPREVIDAVAAAVDEALRNVLRHARTRSARVTLRRGGTSVVVEVADDGVGFDPSQRHDGRLGVRESVVGRMADVGGAARVRSAPGAGTAVELRWPAKEPIRPDGSPTSRRLLDDFDSGLRRSASTFAPVWLLFMLALMIGSWGRYDRPALSVAVWTLTTTVAATAAVVLRRRALRRLEGGGLAALSVVGAVVVGLNTTGGDVVQVVNWFGVDAVPMLLALIVISRPVRDWLPAAIVTDAVVVGVALALAGTAPLDLVRLLAGSHALWSLLIMIWRLRVALRSTALTTAEAAAADVRLETRRRSAIMVARDRKRGARRLADSALPLLAAIAAGTTDPSTPQTRTTCTKLATSLRRILTTAGSANRLAELETAVEAAEDRGVHVEVQVAGDLSEVPPDVRDEVYRAVDRTLLAVPAGPVMLTVLTSGGAGTVVLSFPAPWQPPEPDSGSTGQPGTAGQPATAGQAGTAGQPGTTGLTDFYADVSEGQAYLEISWSARPHDEVHPAGLDLDDLDRATRLGRPVAHAT